MRLAILVSLSVCFLGNMYAQEYRLSQFYTYPVLLNPALTGLGKNLRIASGYKLLPDTGNTTKHVYLSNADLGFFSKKREKIFIGGGGGFMYDKGFKGPQGKYELSLSSAFHLMLNSKNSISAGVYAAVARKKVTVGNDKYAGYAYTDVASGIQWDYNKAEKYISANNNLNLNLGFAAFHLNRPYKTFPYISKERVKPAFQFHGMGCIGILATSISVVPSFSYFNNSNYGELMIGTNIKYGATGESQYASNLRYKVFMIGGLFKYNTILNDYLVANLYCELGAFAVGLSFDYNLLETSKILDNYNAVEISFIFVSHAGYSYNSKIRKWE